MATKKPTMPKACTETVGARGGRYNYQPEHPCPHDAIRDGLCSSHLGARTRRENADKALDESQRARRERSATQDRQMQALKRLGVDASPVVGAQPYQASGLYVEDIDALIHLLCLGLDDVR